MVLEGPQISFLHMIYIPNNHSVAVWHSNWKCIFISLEHMTANEKTIKTHMVDDRFPKNNYFVLQLCFHQSTPLAILDMAGFPL